MPSASSELDFLRVCGVITEIGQFGLAKYWALLSKRQLCIFWSHSVAQARKLILSEINEVSAKQNSLFDAL
jgi:hypothetical protein